MSWLYSQALVAEYLEGNCSAGALSALSNATPTPQAYCAPDKMTDFSRPSRFGMTFAPLTEPLGVGLLTWFLADFPARTSAPLARAQGSTAREAACGGKWPGLLARYDRGRSLWKTPQCSLFGGLVEFSATWPRWGTMRNGECWARKMWERHTAGNEYGLWATPRASANENRQTKPTPSQLAGKHGLSLCAQANTPEMWPTPNVPNGGRSTAHVTDWRGKTAYHNGKKVQVGLESAVKRFPTPTKRDHKGGADWNKRTRDGKKRPESDMTLPDVVEMAGGHLNPQWVEWLMGWPLGWTDLQPLEMGKCQHVRLKRTAG